MTFFNNIFIMLLNRTSDGRKYILLIYDLKCETTLINSKYHVCFIKDYQKPCDSEYLYYVFDVYILKTNTNFWLKWKSLLGLQGSYIFSSLELLNWKHFSGTYVFKLDLFCSGFYFKWMKYLVILWKCIPLD